MRSVADVRRRLVYALVDPETLLIRYVGQTLLSAEDRTKQHVQAARRGDPSYRSNWIRQLLDADQLPDVEVLELGDWTIEQLNYREIYWIDCLKQSPFARLTNMNDGGGGSNRVVSPEALARQVAGIHAWWANPESRKKQSDRLKKYYQDSAAREKTRQRSIEVAARQMKRRIRCTDCGVIGNPMSLIQHGRWHKHYGREELAPEGGE